MRRIYGVRLELDRPDREPADVARLTADQMWAWAYDNAPPRRGWRTGTEIRDGREVMTEEAQQEGAELRRLIVTEPHPGDATARWRWVVDLLAPRCSGGVTADRA